jgi:hypothetical protein
MNRHGGFIPGMPRHIFQRSNNYQLCFVSQEDRAPVQTGSMEQHRFPRLGMSEPSSSSAGHAVRARTALGVPDVIEKHFRVINPELLNQAGRP